MNAYCPKCEWEGEVYELKQSDDITWGDFGVNTKLVCPKCSYPFVELERSKDTLMRKGVLKY